MKTPARLTPRAVLLPLLVLATASVRAQSVAASAPTAATLAKYDLNRNGRLDPSEVATMQADQARAASAPVESGAGTREDTVQLSPFEVNEANNGYYASNTMS